MEKFPTADKVYSPKGVQVGIGDMDIDGKDWSVIGLDFHTEDGTFRFMMHEEHAVLLAKEITAVSDKSAKFVSAEGEWLPDKNEEND